MEHPNEVIAIIFGLIASVLTLVGLISIFVSLNSQYNIQKSRELYWGLLQETKKETIKNKLSLYNDILGGNEKFTPKVIRLVLFTIATVIILSTILITALWAVFNTTEKIIIVSGAVVIYALLIWFGVILLKLKNIEIVSDLPSVKKMLDGHEDTKVKTSVLVSQTLIPEFKIRNDNFSFKVWVTLPVNNVKVYLSSLTVFSTINGKFDFDEFTWEEVPWTQRHLYNNKEIIYEIGSNNFNVESDKLSEVITNGVDHEAILIEEKNVVDFIRHWINVEEDVDLSITARVIVADGNSYTTLTYETQNIFSSFKNDRERDLASIRNGKMEMKDIQLNKSWELESKAIQVTRNKLEQDIANAGEQQLLF